MTEKYSSPTAIVWGVLTSIFGIFTLDQWAVIVGIICTVGTFGVNWHYKRKEFKLREVASRGKDTK